MSKSDIIDIKMQKHAETSKAILASDDGDKEKAVWLPKSQIEIEEDKDGYIIVSLPEWLAMEKKLV